MVNLTIEGADPVGTGPRFGVGFPVAVPTDSPAFGSGVEFTEPQAIATVVNRISAVAKRPSYDRVFQWFMNLPLY